MSGGLGVVLGGVLGGTGGGAAVTLELSLGAGWPAAGVAVVVAGRGVRGGGATGLKVVLGLSREPARVKVWVGPVSPAGPRWSLPVS